MYLSNFFTILLVQYIIFRNAVEHHEFELVKGQAVYIIGVIPIILNYLQYLLFFVHTIGARVRINEFNQQKFNRSDIN